MLSLWCIRARTTSPIAKISIIAALATCCTCAAAAENFKLPGRSGWETWEAEAAIGASNLHVVMDPVASGGKYVDSGKRAGAVLELPFTTAKATTLRVRPVWWRTGRARPARLFPYPLSPALGPDVVGACNTRVIFTAPCSGRLGAVDVRSRKLVGSVHIGGYLTDMLVDDARRRAYVLDALGDRLVVVDAAALKVIGQVKTPAEPWSVAKAKDKLVVACRAAKTLVCIDPLRLRITKRISTDARPISVRTTGDGKLLVVRFQQVPLDAQDLSVLPSDELQYRGYVARTTASVGKGKRYARARAHVLRVEASGGANEIDVSKATRARPAPAEPKYPLVRDPGPTKMVVCGKYLFFTSPDTGNVGVVSVSDDKLVETINVGGYLSDIVAVPRAGLVYVTDALGDRVVVIDANKLKVLRSVRTPDEPWALAHFYEAVIQRPYLLPPTKVDKVYVACRAGRAVVALDARSSKVVARADLDAPARNVWSVPMPNSGWWWTMADDRIKFALHPKVAVESWPECRDPASLAPVHPPAHEVGVAAPRRDRLEVSLAGASGSGEAAAVQVRADNCLVLRVGDQWVDVTSVADPVPAAQRALTSRDAAGSITVQVDDGPEYDWTRGLWMTPDDQIFLVNDSEEYWDWNAPSFRVGRGHHVLRVHIRDRYTRLDAVQVRRSPEQWLDISVSPLPRSVHSVVPLPGYQGLFYYNERPEFELALSNSSNSSRIVRLYVVVLNYMGEPVMKRRFLAKVASRRIWRHSINVDTDELGRFTMNLQALTDDGVVRKRVRFVRLPRLEHPRLMVRRDDLPELRARIAKHPRLYQRYVDWLRRMAPKGGKWPERFLPPGLTRQKMGAAAPDDMKDTRRREQTYGWRMYEAAWRMLAVEFAAMYIAPQYRDELMKYLEPLLQETSTSYYCQYHHHGPFFPGAVASLVDMAPEEKVRSLPLYDYFKRRRGDMNVFPWTLVALEEPLRPEDRALIWRIAMFENSAERYFSSHCGHRGGTWWQNPWTGCHCPLHGWELTFIYLRNFFDEPRLFEKPFFRGFLTFHRYLDPIADNRRLMPARRGPLGEPWRWILCSLTRHPLEKSLYRWDEWLAKLDAPGADSPEVVSRLMNLEGMPYVGPIRGGQHHFTTGVVVPVALALGWYDPDAPTVTWDELPPTALFDVEGWAVMRSGWDQDATEVFFNCGVRDHTPRGVPNHFMIWQAGEALIGWPALWWDDGNNTPRWGNVVVAGEKWLDRWRMNLTHARDGEHFVINRFSKLTWTCIARDGRLISYAPAEAGWGGGIDLHGHTETFYMREGQVIAYRTTPQYDYVAGDASNAWPLDEMVESYRQLVFVKPDTVIVYDRIKLGEGVDSSALVLATGPEVSVEGRSFTIGSGEATLRGQVLLPAQARLSLPPPPAHYQWKGQKLLRIDAPASEAPTVEYLAVYRTGVKSLPKLDVRMVHSAGQVGVSLTEPDRRPIVVKFNRPGRGIGGVVIFGSGATAARQELPDRVEDTYRRWASYGMYEAWVTQPRFDFVVLPADRRR